MTTEKTEFLFSHGDSGKHPQQGEVFVAGFVPCRTISRGNILETKKKRKKKLEKCDMGRKQINTRLSISLSYRKYYDVSPKT